MRLFIMKRYAYLIYLVLLLLCGVDFYAQQWTYPEDMLNVEYPYFTTVKFEGASPDIADFVTSYISDLDTTMDGTNYVDVWNRYLRQEELRPGTEVVVDKKNGYVRITTEYSIDFDGKDHIYKTIHEMCYWNCADGKHKLFALNFNILNEGRYLEGQSTGLSLSLYDNARHIMWDIAEYELGVEANPKSEEESVITYWLPREGKDIIEETHYATRTETVKLVWDGMKFEKSKK